MTKEALKLALEALQVATTPLTKDRQEVLRAITAIKEALAQPDQGEPVALTIYRGELCYKSQSDDQSFGMWCPVTQDLPFPEGTKFYTIQPQRKPLTDEQIEEIAEGYLVDYRIPAGCAWNFARDIEATHGIKE